MDPIKLDAELHFKTQDGKSVVSLVLKTGDSAVFERLSNMAWDEGNEVKGLRYCHVNRVYPHTIGPDLEGGLELVMTVNYDPWNDTHIPPTPSE